MSIVTVNPFTEEILERYPFHTEKEISTILNQSAKAFIYWKNISFEKRAALFQRLIHILLRNKEIYAAIMMREMGRPITTAVPEIEKCTMVCRYYAENAEKFLADEIIKTEASESYITHTPIGTVLGVMPWNFPFWQVLRFAVPTMMAGNTVLLKHSPNTTGCALAIEKAFEEAGFPKDTFKTLIVGIPQITDIIKNPTVKAVSLTGSVQAGKSVAKTAGEAVKKTVLELGGSDPYIILEDADIEKAVKLCVTSRLINSGQTCISAKRFFVMEHQQKVIEDLFVEEMKKFKIDKPENKNTLYGPLARKDIRDSLHTQVVKSINEGAECILGGNIPDRKGFLYEATVLTNVKKGMTAFDEETFGPVAAIIPVKNEKEAVELANATEYGLGGAVFTKDIERGRRIGNELEVGLCAINDFVKSDPRLPFGGIKNSGYGREISHHGIKEFVNIKSVYMK
ncbi:MAG: NAD-dependent succinate-semialdehyde dehydrogenase [Victivallales bacterium]|nr:NAD-dependent succinate-semialdehyde dehydrogenase [Victivallales bacterium]MCF7888908.1 NAD-dependent succinate-semialdehyde dehydrogenase [Victivallales bacterium]